MQADLADHLIQSTSVDLDSPMEWERAQHFFRNASPCQRPCWSKRFANNGRRLERKGERMNRTTSLFLLLCGLLLTLRADASFAAQPEALTLPGIAKLVVGTASIEVTIGDSLQSMELIPEPNDWSTDAVKRLTAKVGDTFTVTDRHHLTFVYKLVRIRAGTATIKATYLASLPGGPEHRTDYTQHIRTYGVAAAEPKR